MKDDALADAILRGLYETQTPTGRDDLEEIALAKGFDNRIQLDRVCDDLHDRGLITDYSNIDTIIGKITSRAAQAIQAIGETDSVMEYLRRSESLSFGNVNFYGDVANSNIAAHSPGARQAFSAGPDIASLLGRMAEFLKADASLTDEKRNEALADLESLQAEAGKPKPNMKVARFLLGTLGVVGSVAELATKIKAAWGIGG
jgi:hypothetical protein